MPELLPIDRDVVLVHPVGVEDWALQGLLPVDVGKVGNGSLIYFLHSPKENQVKNVY